MNPEARINAQEQTLTDAEWLEIDRRGAQHHNGIWRSDIEAVLAQRQPAQTEFIPCVDCGHTGMFGRTLDKTLCGPCYNTRKEKLREAQIEKAAKAAYERFMIVAANGKPLEPYEVWENIPTARMNDWKDAVEAAAPYLHYSRQPAQSEPVAAQPEMVERMCEAYSGWDDGIQIHGNKKRMAAAAALCLDEALTEPTENEMIATANSETNWKFTPNGDYDRVRKIFANRRARLSAPKPVEERVTIGENEGVFRVYLDGKWEQGFGLERDAERYAAGLRAELKESEGKQ